MSVVASKPLVSTYDKTSFKKADLYSKEYEQTTAHTLGLQLKASIGRKNEADFRDFVCLLLFRKFLSPKVAEQNAKYAYHKGTLERYSSNMKRWLFFCKEKEKNMRDFSMNTVLEFLIDLQEEQKVAYSMIKSAAQFTKSIQKLAGEEFSFSGWSLLEKFLSGAFNANPPMKRKSNRTWNVNILLDFLVTLRSNDSLCINTLAGKSILLILLTTMCRLGDVQQLQIFQMDRHEDKIIFSLLILTKTYNNKTYRCHPQLQSLTLQSFHNDKLLCPVKTLTDYIVQTKEVRMGLDKIFVCVRPDSKEEKIRHHFKVDKGSNG